MAIHCTAANGMGASTLSGSIITNTGMKVEDHMHISEDYLTPLGGVVDTAYLVVQQNGTPNKSVNVTAGKGYILNQAWTVNSVNQNRFWRFVNSATVNVVINDNTSGNPRITSIFAKFTVATTPNDDADNVVTFVAVDGTPAASPTPPATPGTDGYLRLADVTVANGFTSIVDANIVDVRMPATLAIGAGWESMPETVTYVSADSPIFIARITGVDLSAKYTAGMKFRCYQSGTLKQFIINRVQFTGGNTDLTLHGGTDYTLANATIYKPQYSSAACPAGWLADKGKWTVSVTGQSFAQQATPSANTWYNIGTKLLDIPIGTWLVSYSINVTYIDATAATLTVWTTLSTANNSESDSSLTANTQIKTSTSDTKQFAADYARTRLLSLVLTSKTRYYLNEKVTEAGVNELDVDAATPYYIKAVNAFA